EYSRMDSQWFFRWHNLNIANRIVDVDDFKGGRIQTGGVLFDGSAELIYWETISRYFLNKINDVFERAEHEIRVTSCIHATPIAEETAQLLRSYCQRIFRHAIDTARRVKGRGFPNEQYASAHCGRVSFAAEI